VVTERLGQFRDWDEWCDAAYTDDHFYTP